MKNAVKFNDHNVCEFLFKILDVSLTLKWDYNVEEFDENCCQV